MSDDSVIIVKKVVKGGGGHHGGAWKVAYADFVTAMMAFFLLLWLLNVTTDEQKHGIADYFAPSAASRSTQGAGGVMGGRTLAPKGARISDAAQPTVVVELTPPRQRDPADEDKEGGDIDEEELLRRMAEREQNMFEEAEQELRQAIQESANAAELAKHLIVDNTPEGLRIQLVDQDKRSMFQSGSNKMSNAARELLQKVAQIVNRMPNALAITGHTDATPFRGRSDYGNWELSSERANASRRGLLEYGIDASRISHVAGKAATEPLIPDDPTNPTNRRISIVLLRQTPVLPPGGVK